MKSLALAYVLCAMSLLASCGGGSGGGEGPGGDVVPTNMSLQSVAALDGSVTFGGNVISLGGGPAVGDRDSIPGEGDVRQFYTFDAAPVPAGATIVSATLRLYQAFTIGDAIGENGPIVVDYLDYGPTLNSTDFNRPAIQANIGMISGHLSVGWRALDVTVQVQDAINSGRDPQFRLACDHGLRVIDGMDDLVHFTDREDSCCSTGNLPALSIAYTP